MIRANPVKWRSIAGVLLVAALVTGMPACAHADAGIPMLPVRYPQILWFLVLVIAVEGIYLQTVLGTRWRRTLLAVAGANLVTMALGYPLVWAIYMGLNLMMGFPQARVDLFSFQEWGPVWVYGHIFPNWSGLGENMTPIFVMFVVMLIPSYLLTRLVKLRLLRWYDLVEFKGDLKPAVVAATRISYIFLAVSGCILLYRFYSHL